MAHTQADEQADEQAAAGAGKDPKPGEHDGHRERDGHGGPGGHGGSGGPGRPLPARVISRLRRTRRVVWLTLLVAASAVLVQWVIMTPPLYFDPYYVWLAARSWPDIPLTTWPFDEVPHQVTRIGLVLPARLVQEVLGTGEAAYFTVAALGGCAFFAGTYLVVRSLFGDAAGLASAAILLVHPFFTLTNPFGHEITDRKSVV